MVEQSLTQIRKQALEPPANRSFVHVKDPADLGERLAIEEIRAEQVAFFDGNTLERNSDGAGQASKFCGTGAGSSCGTGASKVSSGDSRYVRR